MSAATGDVDIEKKTESSKTVSVDMYEEYREDVFFRGLMIAGNI